MPPALPIVRMPSFRFIAKAILGGAMLSSLLLAGGCVPSVANEDLGNPFSPTVANVRNNGVLHSGFLVGTGGILTSLSVLVSVDNGAPTAAIGTSTWSFQLPTGAATWRDGSAHSVTVTGLGAGSSFSTTLTVRKGTNWDVNGDGYPDVAVGSDPGTAGNAAYIIYSTAPNGVSGGSLATTPTLAATSLTGGGTFGCWVALGDVNGDGYADLIVGANGGNAVYEFLSTGTAGIPNAAAPNATVTGGAGSAFGYPVVVGDVNGDGYTDVVTGAANSNPGQAFVFHGSSTGIANLGAPNTTLTGPAGITGFGNFIGLGDINGDGFPDVAVTAANVDSAYVFYSAGSGGIPSNTPCSSNACPEANASFTTTGTVVPLGTSISVGDVNGDGFADIIVGARGLHVLTVYMSTGSGGVLSAQCSTTACPEASVTLTASAGTVIFGDSQTIGDVNGDGFNDLVIGNPNNSGVYVILSQGSSGLPAVSELGASTFITSGGGGGDGFARRLIVHDLNGDGFADLIVGAPLVSANQGQLWQFLSQGASGISSADLTVTPSAGTVLQGATSSAFGGAFDQ